MIKLGIFDSFFKVGPSVLVMALGGILAGCDGTDQQIKLSVNVDVVSVGVSSVVSSQTVQSSVEQASSISFSSVQTPPIQISSSNAMVTSSAMTASSLRPVRSSSAQTSTLVASSRASSIVTSTSAHVYSSSSRASNNNASTSSFVQVQSSTSSSMASVTYFPETPARIPLDYTLTVGANSPLGIFDIDDFAANTETGVGYAIDKDSSVIFTLNLLSGDVGKISKVPAYPTGMAYLQSEGLIAVVASLSPRLVILNAADFSQVDTVAFDYAPTDVVMSEGGILVVSFANGDPLFVYDMVAAKVLPPLTTPSDSQFSFVGETLVVTSASHPSELWRYDFNNGVFTDLGVLNFDGLNLGAIVGNAKTSNVVVTDTGLLLDKNTFALVDTINYGQSKFKQVEFLTNSDYAISVDDQNYLRLFDARSDALDYGVANDTRRIGANSSLQSRTINALAVYRDSAFAIHPSFIDSNRYAITQLQLPPYLTSERLIDGAESESSSSAVSSERVNSSAGSNSSGQVTSSPPLVSSSSMANSAGASSAYPYVVLDLPYELHDR